ncbi:MULTISPECIES: hypothetical protein [Pseudomonas]|jgi:hypothetical protein|uniref:HEAT repeat domain-containing protein n=1 Tax=Pseudomonas tensinigenes TaxID=2745511 RepID=A0ABX8PS07_9PSED|nr:MULTISPECIES: hypothetical protein [Pseudomonas]QXI04079.1 hypothetical protein HU718_018790 [Pseudomonas tensinigenes]
MSLIYQNPSINHDEAVRLLSSGIDANVIAALVSIGLNETDRNWAQDICLKHLTSKTEAIVAAAATALGHIARRHGEVDTETVFLALESARRTHPSLQGIIEDALDDIDVFT